LILAKKIIEKAKEEKIEISSVVGHEGTAKLLSSILSINISYNRINYTLNDSDILLVFTLQFRIEEGRVYSREELEKVSLNIFLVYKSHVFGGWPPFVGAIVEPDDAIYEFLKSAGIEIFDPPIDSNV